MSFGWDFDMAPHVQASTADLEDAGFMLSFISQADAEAWLGEHYMELQDYGVAQVTLKSDDSIVYGPMGLANSE